MEEIKALSQLRLIEETAKRNADQKSLELLFDYTKFHIGLYLTLAAAYMAAASLQFDNRQLIQLDLRLVVPALMSFMIAGLAGGWIASSITQTEARSAICFLKTDIGLFRARIWMRIEHIMFWLGLVLAACSFWPDGFCVPI